MSIKEFLQGQIDYIYFIYGLSLILLAMVCQVMKKGGIPWYWLGLFGLTNGMARWIDIIRISWPGKYLAVFQLILIILSFIFLLEFGRANTAKTKNIIIKRWFLIPMLAITVFLTILAGLNGLFFSCHYIFGLTGGLWTALSLYENSKKTYTGSLPLIIAAGGMALYTLSTLANVPDFMSMTYETYLPVQLFRFVIIIIVTTAIWIYFGMLATLTVPGYEKKLKKHYIYGTAIINGFIRKTAEKKQPLNIYFIKNIILDFLKEINIIGLLFSPRIAALAMALLLILNVINGWLAANTVGKAADKQMGDLLIKRSNTVVSSIDCERIKNLIKTHMEKENYEFLKNQIMNICVANPDFNFVYLLTRKEGKLIFLIDYISVGTYKSLKSDKIYQKSLTHIINSFTSDKTSVEGPSSDERGSWAESYSPIQDRETNQVIGVLVINTDVTEWKHIIAVNRLNPILITIIISILIIVFFIIHQKSLEVSFKIAAKEKERIEGELKIAHDIQMNMLPLLPLTESQSFRIYGFMEPAREVGGDFYDFFILDDKLCFIIGDVSDKGVPAALFMAVINSLYRYIASEGKSPSVVLEKLNKKVINNQSFMFVTAFCGMLDLKTGKLKYSNAGHNTPYIIKNNQKAKMMEKATTSVLGIKEEKYVDKELILEPGDYLFTYTDGVTEATGNEHELFGDERLKEILSARYYTSPEEMVGVVSGNVKEFSGNLEQSDDITMLVIKYMKGNQ